MPPFGLHEQAGARARLRVGERAARVAEQLALEQRLGHRGAVDRDERARRARRLRWWSARATSSLPVPLSPVISTVASVVGDAVDQLVDRAASPGCAPISSSQPLGARRRPRAQALDLVAQRAVLHRARRASVASASSSNGLVMKS